MTPRRLRGATAPLGAVALVALLFLSGLAGLSGSARAAGAPPGLARTNALPAPTAHGPRAAAPTPPASGAGTFFTTTPIPDPSTGHQTCFASVCVNASNDGAINLSSDGDLVTAYTAYTNESPCAAARGSALSEIGIVRSTNAGSTWSTPAYLGPGCGTFASAWEPSLTSLGNGTFVLVFIEYNATTGTVLPNAQFGPLSYNVPQDRLVLTESYDGGATWTTPAVLNSSSNTGLDGSAFAPQRPWVVATGQTIYVTWVNATEGLGLSSVSAPIGSSQAHLLVSTDGGATWGSRIDLPAVGPAGDAVALNPTVAVGTNGELLLAYATNFSYHPSFTCSATGCINDVWTADIEVATSTNNGTTLATTTAAAQVIAPFTRWGSFHDPSPQFAVDPSGSQVYLTYSAGAAGLRCVYPPCVPTLEPQLVFVQNSSDGGATWSGAHAVAPQLAGFAPFGTNALYNPAIAVGPNGDLELEATFVNYSVCQLGAFGNFCGPQYQIFLNSTDQGQTFSDPILISDNATQLLYNPNNPDGEYTTMIAADGTLFLAWSADTCPVWNGTSVYAACVFPGTGGRSAVQVSQLATGAGLTLTFTETGLPAGTVWTVNVMGNLRSATAPTSLSVGGIPTGENLTWNLTALAPYGTRYAGTATVNPPYLLPTTTTVAVSFTTEYLVDVTTVPSLQPAPLFATFCTNGYPPFSWDNAVCPTVNYNITPVPGPQWVPAGTTLTLSTTPIGSIYCGGTCFGDDLLNVTFLSWKGTGAGSANTTANTTTVTANGPVNETASYHVNGWCSYGFAPGSYSCLASNATLGFHESGLPDGVRWGMTFVPSGGNATSVTSTSAWITPNTNLTASLLNFTAWTVPDPATGDVWLPTVTPSSPVELPGDSLVQVNYSLVNPATVDFPVTVAPLGLPPTSSWSFSLDGTSYGAPNASSPATVAALGGSHSFNGGPITEANQSRFLVSGVDTLPLAANATWSNFTTLPASLSLASPLEAWITYATQYWVAASAGVGGQVTGGDLWASPGAAVSLTATPLAGYSFAGWTGTGSGSSSGATPAITVHPNGPVTELATFVPLPAPTWNVTVVANGLPPGLELSIGLGNRTFAGANGFVIHGLATGNYSVALPDVYDNASSTTRIESTLAGSTFATTPSGALEIDSSGTLTIAVIVDYRLSLAVAGNGSIALSAAGATTPAATGGWWFAAATPVTLTATPSAGATFVGWSGDGSAALNSSRTVLALVLAGPAAELAQFVPTVAPPSHGFSLVVVQSGLPSTVPWAASVGSTGGTALGTTLTLAGLNGSYTLTFPTLSGGAGVRYVPTPASLPVTVGPGGARATVQYEEQFLVTALASAGGSISASLNGTPLALPAWIAGGATVTVTATPGPGESFVGWGGPNTTPTITMTLNTAAQFVAEFAPTPSGGTTGAAQPNATSGMAIGIGLLVVLLIVGLAVGVLLARRGRSPPAVEEAPVEAEAPPAESVPEDSGAPPPG
jgi:hypothetical protein